MAHRHVTDQWAEQQKHERTGSLESGNMSYRKRTIYSYHWWPIARIIDTENKVALFRAETYSVSTSRHQTLTRQALSRRGYKIIDIPRITHENSQFGGNLTESDHMVNLEWFERQIEETLEQADRARLYRDTRMSVADSLIEAMSDYIDYFDLG